MFIQMSILRPKSEYDAEVVASMHRFQDALKGAVGMIGAHTMRDSVSGSLVGVVFWASEACMKENSEPALSAIENDPFDEWLTEPIANFRLEDAS